MNFTNKLSLILESILLRDGEYTIEDTPNQNTDPDALPDVDKFGEDTKTYYLKKNNNILTTIKMNDDISYTYAVESITIDNEEYETHPTIQKFLSQNPSWVYYYALEVLRSRFPLGEKTISTDPKWAYDYARFLESRFPLGEPAISQNPEWAYWYARFVLKSRFPLGEKTISQDPRYWNEYKRHFNIAE